jgi:hypothetical protein
VCSCSFVRFLGFCVPPRLGRFVQFRAVLGVVRSACSCVFWLPKRGFRFFCKMQIAPSFPRHGIRTDLYHVRVSIPACARARGFSPAGVGFSSLRPAPQLAGPEGACSMLWARSCAASFSARGLSRVLQSAVLARVSLASGRLGRRRRLPAWRTAAACSGLGYSVRLVGSARLVRSVRLVDSVGLMAIFCCFLRSARPTRISRGSAKSRCRIATSFVVGSVGFCRVGRSSETPLGNILQPTSKTPKTAQRALQGPT